MWHIVTAKLLRLNSERTFLCSLRSIECGAVDFIISSCKRHTSSSSADLLRFAALALVNLAIHSDGDCLQKIIAKNVSRLCSFVISPSCSQIPEWLFLLASYKDPITCYYACLAVCVLVSNKEIETAVMKSGTMSLVEPFLNVSLLGFVSRKYFLFAVAQTGDVRLYRL